MTRDFLDVQKTPVKGDTVEITEPTKTADGEFVVMKIMLRVMAVEEGWVWFKQYGRGRYCCVLSAWRSRLGQATQGKIILAGKNPTQETLEALDAEHRFRQLVTEGQNEACETCLGKGEIEAYRGEPSQGTETIQCPDCAER
jgi:hypothetical protein